MTLQPVVLPVILAVIAIALLGLRVVALRRACRGTDAGSRRRAVLRWGVLTLAAVSLLIAAARPGISAAGAVSGSGAPVAVGAPVNVFFVLDRSVHTRVEDFGDATPRMAGIRGDITALIDHYRGAQFALISFSSTATMDWPLSDDVWSLKPFVAGLSADTADSLGAANHVDAGAAGGILANQLANTAQRSRRSTNLVFYFGVGAGGSRTAQSSFELGADFPAGGAVFGYGTPAGGPIPQRIVDGQVAYATDPTSGARLISAIDEPDLQRVAQQLGVPYVHRQGGQVVSSALPRVDTETTGPTADSGVGRTVELYWVFALVAAALVLTEIVLVIWQFRRRRSVRMEVAS